MLYIKFRDVQAAREGLLEQIFVLREIQERLEQAERRVREMSFTEETCRLLRKNMEAVSEEMSTLQKMADCLEAAEQAYRKTEQKIADEYNLEVVRYPRTVFARSSFSGLEENLNNISFRAL